jgi:hypothetical protein
MGQALKWKAKFRSASTLVTSRLSVLARRRIADLELLTTDERLRAAADGI